MFSILTRLDLFCRWLSKFKDIFLHFAAIARLLWYSRFFFQIFRGVVLASIRAHVDPFAFIFIYVFLIFMAFSRVLSCVLVFCCVFHYSAALFCGVFIHFAAFFRIL